MTDPSNNEPQSKNTYQVGHSQLGAGMIQCETCEFFSRDSLGKPVLHCDPYSTIKEPACLLKHQLIRLDVLSQSHQSTLEMHQRLAPLQEKMMRHLEREIDEQDEADAWKHDDSQEYGSEEYDEDDPFRI